MVVFKFIFVKKFQVKVIFFDVFCCYFNGTSLLLPIIPQGQKCRKKNRKKIITDIGLLQNKDKKHKLKRKNKNKK